MDLKEEILEEYFKKLGKVDDFPQSVIEDLKKLFEDIQAFSKESVMEIIIRWYDSVSQD